MKHGNRINTFRQPTRFAGGLGVERNRRTRRFHASFNHAHHGFGSNPTEAVVSLLVATLFNLNSV